METIKLDVKTFAEGYTDAKAQCAVFHRWIQQSRLKELLIDVADYSHVHQGPGVLLMFHGGHFALDEAEGQLGLLYSRRRGSGQGVEGDLVAQVSSALATTWTAAGALLEEPELRSSLRFPGHRLRLTINDRAAGDEAPRLRTVLERLAEQLFPDGPCSLEALPGDRPGFELRTGVGAEPATLLDRLRPASTSTTSFAGPRTSARARNLEP